jgi:hypothetical protein
MKLSKSRLIPLESTAPSLSWRWHRQQRRRRHTTAHRSNPLCKPQGGLCLRTKVMPTKKATNRFQVRRYEDDVWTGKGEAQDCHSSWLILLALEVLDIWSCWLSAPACTSSPKSLQSAGQIGATFHQTKWANDGVHANDLGLNCRTNCVPISWSLHLGQNNYWAWSQSGGTGRR